MEGKQEALIKSRFEKIKHDFHAFANLMNEKYGGNHLHLECVPPDCNKDWIEFINQILKRAEDLMSKIKSNLALYLPLILIKGFCKVRILLGWKEVDEIRFIRNGETLIKECEKMLRPYKRRAEGIWLYVMNQVIHVKLIECRIANGICGSHYTRDARKGLTLIEDAENEYRNFVNFKMEKPWGIDEIFSCKDSDGNLMKSNLADDFEKFNEFTMKTLLLQFAFKTADEQKIMKYGIDGLKPYLKCTLNHKNLHLFAREAYLVVEQFINAHYFAQVQHIAAVVMYTVVQFRRSLPEKERTTVNPIQREASFIYAELGNRLVRKSWDIFMNKKLHQDYNTIQVPPNFHIDDCERLLPPSPELLVYEKVFPTKLTEDPQEFNKLQSTTKQWLKRMHQLEQSNTAPIDLCLERNELVDERLDSIATSSKRCSMQ